MQITIESTNKSDHLLRIPASLILKPVIIAAIATSQ